MDKYLKKSSPFESAKKRKRTFWDHNGDSDTERTELPTESPRKKRRIEDDMMVPEEENYSDYEDTTDNRFPVESAQSLKAKLRRMEASVLQLDAENQRLKEKNKNLETKVNSSERKSMKSAIPLSLSHYHLNLNSKLNFLFFCIYNRENYGRDQ